MLFRSLNELRRRESKRYVVTVVTQVVVDENDPAFQAPSKPIGPFLSKEEAERRRDQLGWRVKEDAGRGWRRLVPSPAPLRVIQRHMIREAARSGHIVIACGGGTLPTAASLPLGSARLDEDELADAPSFDAALANGAAFAADGKSVNNVLGFPGIFRGAVDSNAPRITHEMLIAAMEALVRMTPAGELMPNPLDKKVHQEVARAVAEIAMKQGIARAEYVPYAEG